MCYWQNAAHTHTHTHTHTCAASVLLFALQVPNVKFNAAKMLAKIAPLLERQVIEHHVKPCLAELCEDADMDVRFYAREALFACEPK